MESFESETKKKLSTRSFVNNRAKDKKGWKWNDENKVSGRYFRIFSWDSKAIEWRSTRFHPANLLNVIWLNRFKTERKKNCQKTSDFRCLYLDCLCEFDVNVNLTEREIWVHLIEYFVLNGRGISLRLVYFLVFALYSQTLKRKAENNENAPPFTA